MNEQFTTFNSLNYLDTVELCHAYIRVVDDDLQKLIIRYDDAMKRMNDMQAELEYLRQEVNRG